MEENNNKPIGFIQINRLYADSRSALRDILGYMPNRFRLKKIPYGAWRSETRSAPALGGPFIWFGAHMGVCCGVPAAPDEVLEHLFESAGGTHFRENVRRARTREFCEKNVEMT